MTPAGPPGDPGVEGTGWTPERAAVTVVIPTHNRMEYLREAVASVLAQGPALAEVIIVNDGSTDATGDWLDGPHGTRVSVVHQYPAAGGSAARNEGLARCRTPFVLFLDDDDRLRPGALDHLIAALRRHPEAVGAAGAVLRFGATTERPRVVHPRVPVVRPVWPEVLFCWGMYPAALLWRTAVVADLGGWDEQLRRFEDRDLVLRAGRRPFALIPQAVADFRVHPGQVTNVAFEELDWRLREEFAAGLQGRDRAVARAVIDAARPFEAAMDAYRGGDFGPARAALTRALRPETTLRRSPVLGPWLASLAVKSTLLSGLPRPARAALRSARNGRRQAAGAYQNPTR